MSLARRVSAALALAACVGACSAPSRYAIDHQHAVDAAFTRLAGLQGEWLDTTGSFGAPDVVQATWRLTGGGSAVVETLFPGTPDEMVTVYHKDGHDLVLTHYCAAGNQPRMRATYLSERMIQFAFDGGFNIDPARDMHMHSGKLEFVSGDELHAEWQGWEGGKADPGHLAQFHLVRRKGS